MTSPKPFRIDVSDDVLERIRAKVAGYVWHEMPDDGGWAYGANLDYMKESRRWGFSPGKRKNKREGRAPTGGGVGD